MNWRILTCGLMVLVSTSYARGQDWSQWRFRAPLELTGGPKEYGEITLTPPVYGCCRGNLSDIRLVGADGAQIPYLRYRDQDKISREQFEPAILHRSSTPEGAANITVDFGANVIKNMIAVDTDGYIFRRAVKVEGSHDNERFYLITSHAYIFAVAYRDGVQQFNHVTLPRNDFRYLRITVMPESTATRPVEIEAVTISYTERTPAPQAPVELLQIEHQEDTQNQSSIFVYDLQFDNIPLSTLQFDVADEAFYRYVTVEGRDRATRQVEIIGEDTRARYREEEVPWRHLASEAIFFYTTENNEKLESRQVDLSLQVNTRYLKLTVKNYDDKPLTVRSVRGRMRPDVLVFPRAGAGPFYLYMGNENISAPKYDLALRVPHPENIECDTATIGPIEANPLWGEQEPVIPWTEKNKTLVLALLGLLVLILGLIIGKSMKSTMKQS